MTEEMIIESTYVVLDGLELHATGDLWTPVPAECALEILRDWRRREGSEKFVNLVDAMRGGHVVSSPHVPGFRYRAGSLAGRQQQLF